MNRFIAIEGVDGTGKTSLAKSLAERLGMIYYKSPSGAFNKYRSLVDSNAKPFERFSFYRLAVQHDSSEIHKLLSERGVVADRYIASTLAYHTAMDRRVLEIHSEQDLLLPDLTIFLNASKDVRRQRILQRRLEEGKSTDLVLEDNQEFLDKVVQEFREIPGLHEINTDYLDKDQVLSCAVKLAINPH